MARASSLDAEHAQHPYTLLPCHLIHPLIPTPIHPTTRPAGQQGGKAGCLALTDDQGLPQCGFQSWCNLDWALQCDASSACCLRPAELLARDVDAACSNATTAGADTVCGLDIECYSRWGSGGGADRRLWWLGDRRLQEAPALTNAALPPLHHLSCAAAPTPAPHLSARRRAA